MNKIVLFAAILFYYFNINGQDLPNNCNQTVDVKTYKNKIIKEVCIPNGYVITKLYSNFKTIDLDGDSLGDFVFSYRKDRLKDGDTTFIAVYKRMNDSTHKFLKAFNNLLPIYLSRYDIEPKDSSLINIFICYDQRNPLLNMEMKDGVISLNLRIDAASSLLLKYKYYAEKGNWFLFYSKELLELPSGRINYVDKELPKKLESIDDFSYQKYLCPTN